MPKIDLNNISKQLKERLRALGAKVEEIEGVLCAGQLGVGHGRPGLLAKRLGEEMRRPIEYVEKSFPVVVKNDGRREPFDRKKLEKGIDRACEKRPVSAEDMRDLIDRIIAKITEEYSDEVSVKFIGEIAMELLHEVDQIAYVRFASVYRKFKDVSQFKEELDKLLK